MKEGDLPVTILYLEAAILQEPNDAEVFTAKEKAAPFSMGCWNDFWAQTFQSGLTETLDSKGQELVCAFKQIPMGSSQDENLVLKYCCSKYFKQSLHIMMLSNYLVNTAIKKMNIFDLTRLLKNSLKLYKFLQCCCFQLVYF